MASAFPVGAAYQHDLSDVRYLPVDSAATFVVSELVYFDTSSQTLKGCGADPSLIAGIAKAPASMGLDTKGSIWGSTNIPVQQLRPSTVCFMASSTTPALTHVGNVYGVEKTGTNWRVDISDTSNTRLIVVGISNSPLPEGFYVQFIAANLQFDAVAS